MQDNMLRNINLLNIFLMLVALMLAYVLPFHLFFLAYALLGPLHYLTQISWMHDRRLFVGKDVNYGLVCAVFIAMTLLICFFNTYMHIWFAFAFALAVVLGGNLREKMFIFIFSSLSLFFLTGLFQHSTAYIAVLLPTVVHVSLFTALFVLFGSVKSGSKTGYASVVVYIACALFSCLVEPSTALGESHPLLNDKGYFDYLIQTFLQAMNWSEAKLAQVMFFLSFAYTYHYLNWFSKVNVLKWANVSKKRLYWVFVFYVITMFVYVKDFYLGLKLMVFLSVLHVLMEFPLNVFVVKELFKYLPKIPMWRPQR